MGLRKKISLGFVIIATILLFSGLISIYEFISMRKSVSNLISDNIASINTSTLLLEVSDEYNFELLMGMGSDSIAKFPDIENDNRFSNYLEKVKNKFTTANERTMADSILYAYSAYMNIIKQAPNIWHNDYQIRRAWYFNRLYPVYTKLRKYIQNLTHISQKALAENSQTLNDSFYRSIMPGVVAISIGLILVLLFNYYINFFFISPILKIIKGIKNSLDYNKSYNISVENDDELGELNDIIKEIADTNKTLKSKQQ
jgi:hypothetical protein